MNEPLLLAGICLAASLSGAFGLAFPLVAGPLFLLEYEPSKALLLTASCTLLSNLLSAAILHQTIKYELRWTLLAPVLIGVPIGTELLTRLANASGLRVGFGLLLIATASFCLLPWRFVVKGEHRALETIVGIFSGVIGGMFAAPVALPAIWLNLRGVRKLEIRAILQPLIIFSQVEIIAVMGITASIDAAAAQSVLLYVPSLVAEVILGIVAFNRISNEAFGKAVNVLVVITGFAILIR